MAEDGEAGLQMAMQYLPSAIILDVGLPRTDGWTVMERLKSNTKSPLRNPVMLDMQNRDLL